MPRVEVGYAPGAEALQTTASPNIQTVQTRFDPNESKAYQLAAALGKAQPVIEKFNEDWERKKLQEQILKEGFYKQQFAKDSTGPVTAAQVGERFPETVPIVRARVAEGVGAEHAKTAVQAVIDEINNNAELSTDAGKRAEFIKQKKAELFKNIPADKAGNEFYISGFNSGVEKELGQWENGWQRKSAEYYRDVQSKDFSGKVVDALNAQDPGKALEELDAQWKSTSSLSNLDRNKLVIDTTVKQAFASDNPALLDKIPTRFLNAETRAQVAHTKLQIQEARMTTIRNAQTIQNIQREEDTRKAKVEMIEKMAKGEDINPALYRNNPDAFQFALSSKELSIIPESVSQANVQKARAAILSGSTTQGLDQNAVIDSLLANKNISPKDRADLIKEVPKLIEGTIAMQDDMVKSVYSTRIGSQLDQLGASQNARISNIVTGTNLRGNAVKMFDMGIRNSFYAYFQENGKWPTGFAKQKLVDEVADKTDQFIQNQIKIGGTPTDKVDVGTPPQQPQAKPQAAPTGAVKINNDAEYNALKPGTLFVGPDGVTRRK